MSKKEDFDKTCDRAIDELHEQLERGAISPEDYEACLGEIQSNRQDYDLHGPWWIQAGFDS
ncbi:MAG: hypothetical protein K2Y14_12435 [Burkholderiales bacterium]|nr:hypothetical protein [Burkholderiales bacterium]